MFELSFIGILVGTLSGFFGIGGGTILVPLLLLLGYETKVAIGISVIQMAFSSIYGSYLNNKKGSLDISMVLFIGIGGFLGALFSGLLTAAFSARTLEFIFLSFAIFALLRLFFKTQEKEQKEVHKLILLLIGFVLGALSMTIGVGGSIILIPLLVGFLHVPLKKAVSAGLFFVIFSSVSGLISHSIEENVDYESGIIIGLASLLGVYIGIHLKDTVSVKLQKNLLVLFYLIVVGYLVQRILGQMI
ncbi:sulfite exporter TauE/SafE family protein [Sulfurimonas sp. SAG-AH-194-L11]|nr:sulfite exporter TauE/SafE family protein [Sulfurimonas sp. SAG-AH-194-L11]MDF1876724.1 sulfite exporter TauE/SafE family protein [Sulfurimonas sp. SAG-AH-194-L11]